MERCVVRILLGGMSGTVVGLLCYYLMSVRMRPGREIMTAIKREQFYVAYQPVVDTQALRVTGTEVLLRWRHPVAGEIPRMPSLTLPNRKDDCAADSAPV